MEYKITVQELEKLDAHGGLTSCKNCGRPTYDGKALDRAFPNGVLLPDGLTVGNRRKFVTVRRLTMCVCQSCRYNVFGAY